MGKCKYCGDEVVGLYHAGGYKDCDPAIINFLKETGQWEKAGYDFLLVPQASLLK